MSNGTRSLSYVERLMSRFEVQDDGCWRWTHGVNKATGYGQIGRYGRTVPAHRAMYEHLREPVPDGLCIDHLCRQRTCVNPEHLEVVTYSVNMLRAVPHRSADWAPPYTHTQRPAPKGRTTKPPAPPRTHCKSGLHEWAPPTLGTKPDGRQWCRPCRTLAKHAKAPKNIEK